MAKLQTAQKKDLENKESKAAAVQELGPEICESVRAIMAEIMGKKELAPEDADRLHVAAAYWFLHMVERLLHLVEPEEKASILWKQVADDVSKEVYGSVTGYLKAPDSHYEYFDTFFMSNYKECSDWMKDFAFPVEPAGEIFTNFMQGFGKWLAQSVEGDVLPYLLEGLAQRWCNNPKFVSFCSLQSARSSSE